MKFIYLKNCSTCIKAKKHLESLNVEFELYNILDGLSQEELKDYISKSNLDVQKFFNTSGQIYKENNYKDKCKQMSNDEKIALLSATPMLIKRPILVTDDQVLVGYKPTEYDKAGIMYGKNK